MKIDVFNGDIEWSLDLHLHTVSLCALWFVIVARVFSIDLNWHFVGMQSTSRIVTQIPVILRTSFTEPKLQFGEVFSRNCWNTNKSILYLFYGNKNKAGQFVFVYANLFNLSRFE